MTLDPNVGRGSVTESLTPVGSEKIESPALPPKPEVISHIATATSSQTTGNISPAQISKRGVSHIGSTIGSMKEGSTEWNIGYDMEYESTNGNTMDTGRLDNMMFHTDQNHFAPDQIRYAKERYASDRCAITGASLGEDLGTS